ncbi:MAG: hypothetical protein AB7E48_03075 [Deferribacterales bacterium]
MEKVGIYLIRNDRRIVVHTNGRRLLIGEVKEGETREQAAVRVLANSAPCPLLRAPVYVIAEKTKCEKIYLFAARTGDTAGLSHEAAETLLEVLAEEYLRFSEREAKRVFENAV